MNLPTALRHLAAAGITVEVLAAQHIDPNNPVALLALVDEEIRAITGGNGVAGYAQFGALTMAREALLPAEHRIVDSELVAPHTGQMAFTCACGWWGRRWNKHAVRVGAELLPPEKPAPPVSREVLRRAIYGDRPNRSYR